MSRVNGRHEGGAMSEQKLLQEIEPILVKVYEMAIHSEGHQAVRNDTLMWARKEILAKVKQHHEQKRLDRPDSGKVGEHLTVDDCIKLYEKEGLIGLVEKVRDIAKKQEGERIFAELEGNWMLDTKGTLPSILLDYGWYQRFKKRQALQGLEG